MLRDFISLMDPTGVVISTVSDNTPVVGPIADALEADAVTHLIAIGTLADADATFAVTMDEGDAANLSDAAAVPSTSFVGTLALAGFTHAHGGKARKIGYSG